MDVKQFAPVDRIRPRPGGDDGALEHTLLPLDQAKASPPKAFASPPLMPAPIPAPQPLSGISLAESATDRFNEWAANPAAFRRQLEVIEQELRELRRDNHELRTQLTYADATSRRFQQELEETRAREEVLRNRLRGMPPLAQNGNGSAVWNPAARPLYEPRTPEPTDRMKLGAEEPGSWSFTWGGEAIIDGQ